VAKASQLDVGSYITPGGRIGFLRRSITAPWTVGALAERDLSICRVIRASTLLSL